MQDEKTIASPTSKRGVSRSRKTVSKNILTKSGTALTQFPKSSQHLVTQSKNQPAAVPVTQSNARSRTASIPNHSVAVSQEAILNIDERKGNDQRLWTFGSPARTWRSTLRAMFERFTPSPNLRPGRIRPSIHNFGGCHRTLDNSN